MKKNNFRYIARFHSDWILLLLGALLFSIAANLYQSQYHFGAEILNHIAGALSGGSLIFLLLRAFRVDEMSDSLLKSTLRAKKLSRDVAGLLYESSRKAAKELIKSGDSFDFQEEYMQYLEPIIKELGPGNQIHAVCGEKEWNKPYIQAYFQENYDAVKRGVSVTRLFLEDKAYDKKVVEPVMIEQKKNGIIVKFVSWQNLDVYNRTRNLRNGFGFVIINSKIVIVHDNIHDPALLFKHHLIISEFNKIFKDLNSRSIIF
ncbi:MAG TPA: hypothetical protein VJY62_06905 [Bacteroidia bacterium]|nr:hypothetical protein [Bacteroidia bacterium]